MKYVQSKDLAKYWEETGYEPDYMAKIYCVSQNGSMTLPEKLTAFKDVMNEEGDKDEKLELYISSMNKFKERFEKDEISEDVVYACEEVYTEDNAEYFLSEQYFNTFYEMKFHIRKICEGAGISNVVFYPHKVYPKLHCSSINATYRFQDDEFEILDLYWDKELADSEEEGRICRMNFTYNESLFPTPFGIGDVLTNVNYRGSLEVVSEDNTSYFLALSGDIVKGKLWNVTQLEFLEWERWNRLSSKKLPLLNIAACLKCGQPIPEEIAAALQKEFDVDEDIYGT